MKAKSEKSNPGKGPKDDVPKGPKPKKGYFEITVPETSLLIAIPRDNVAFVSELPTGTDGEADRARIFLKKAAGFSVPIATVEPYEEVVKLAFGDDD